MKSRNQRIWSDDHEFLKNLASEQEEYIGREYKLELSKGLLTIYALPQRKQKVKRKDAKEARNKRAESAARRD